MLESYIEKIVKYWVLIPVAYFGLGLTTIALYYSPYGINILHYIDFSELITDDFLISTCALFYFAITIFGFNFLKLAGNLSRGDYHYYHLTFNLVPLMIWGVLILRYFVNVFNLPPDSLYILRYSLNFLIPFTICSLCIINLVRATYSTIKNIHKEYKKKEQATHQELNVYMGAFLIAVFSFTIPVIEIQAVNYHNVATTTKVYTKTDTVSSDKDLVVVGQTKNFIFFYRKSNHASKIISLKDVTRIENSDIDNGTKVELKSSKINLKNH